MLMCPNIQTPDVVTTLKITGDHLVRKNLFFILFLYHHWLAVSLTIKKRGGKDSLDGMQCVWIALMADRYPTGIGKMDPNTGQNGDRNSISVCIPAEGSPQVRRLVEVVWIVYTNPLCHHRKLRKARLQSIIHKFPP